MGAHTLCKRVHSNSIVEASRQTEREEMCVEFVSVDGLTWKFLFREKQFVCGRANFPHQKILHLTEFLALRHRMRRN